MKKRSTTEASIVVVLDLVALEVQEAPGEVARAMPEGEAHVHDPTLGAGQAAHPAALAGPGYSPPSVGVHRESSPLSGYCRVLGFA